MAGTGTHLHRLLENWLGIHEWQGCGCKDLAAEMDAHHPDWSERPENFRRIVAKMRQTARQAPDWKLRLAGYLPGAKYPIRRLVRTAIANARQELAQKTATP